MVRRAAQGRARQHKTSRTGRTGGQKGSTGQSRTTPDRQNRWSWPKRGVGGQSGASKVIEAIKAGVSGRQATQATPQIPKYGKREQRNSLHCIVPYFSVGVRRRVGGVDRSWCNTERYFQMQRSESPPGKPYTWGSPGPIGFFCRTRLNSMVPLGLLL